MRTCLPSYSAESAGTQNKALLSRNTRELDSWIFGTLFEEKAKLFSCFSQRNERKTSVESEGPSELLRTKTLESVHLKFNFEAGSLLPLALR